MKRFLIITILLACIQAIDAQTTTLVLRNSKEYVGRITMQRPGINLVFLKEHQIDTETYRSAISQQIEMTGNEIADEFIKAINNVLMILAKKQIYLSFEQAQKEVDDLHKRTSEGIKTAKLRGKQVGRPVGAEIVSKKSVSAKQIILQHSKDFGGTLNDADVLKLIGNISRNTYYKYKRELKN